MEQMLALSLLILHGTCAAALPAPSQGHQDLEFHEDLSTGNPLTMIVGQDLKRMLTETDQLLPETHDDPERHERHDRSKPKTVSVLDQVMDEVLQDPDDAQLRNAVTQLIKEVENRHAKKHKINEVGTNGENIILKTGVDNKLDPNNDKVDTHDKDPMTSHNNNLSDDNHFVSHKGEKQEHNDVKQTRHHSSSKPHNNSVTSVTTVSSDGHGRNAVNSNQKTGSSELLLSLDSPSNLFADLNEAIVDHQFESENADLRNDEDEQIERTLIDSSNSNEDPSFKSWGSDDYNAQYLNGDDNEYDDLIDLRESTESIHFTESGDVSSYVNSDINNDNIVDHIVNYNDDDIHVSDGHKNEEETLINKGIPQNEFNSNLTPVSINDLFYKDILNNLEASTSKSSSHDDLNHALRADIPTTDDSHANDSLKAGTPIDNNTPEPEADSAPELRQANSTEIDHDTNKGHYHHSHSKENGYHSEESDEPAIENVSPRCSGHNKIYNLSFRF